MRISDRIIPAALFCVGLGFVSAFAFEGTGARQDVSPAPSLDAVARPAVRAFGSTGAAPIPPRPIPGHGTTRSLDVKRSLTPVEAFRSGTQALRDGDAESGLTALEYAAEKGHPVAQWKLGRMYADGDQVKRDDLRAFQYFREIVDTHADDSLGTPQARIVAN